MRYIVTVIGGLENYLKQKCNLKIANANKSV